jgi:hypothetical protein
MGANPFFRTLTFAQYDPNPEKTAEDIARRDAEERATAAPAPAEPVTLAEPKSGLGRIKEA